MGAFDDLIPQQGPAAQGGTGLFDDLVPASPAAPDPGREAGLGERFRVNARQGFEGTLAGQAVTNWMNEGNRYGAQADTVREVLRFMADQGLDTAPDTLPNPAQGGTPSPEGPDYLGAGVSTTMPGRGTGDLAGRPLADLQERLAFLEGQQAEGQAAFEAERAPILARREQMPSWYEEEGTLGKLLAGATALGGQLTGGTPSPENLLAFGRGANLAGRLGRGAAGGAAGAGVAEPVVQQQELRRGEREAVDPLEGAFNVALGAALGGVLNITPDMARAVRRMIAGRRGVSEAEVTPEDVQAFDPEELLATAQQASEAREMDPDSLAAAIQAATGEARAPVGEGMAPQDARRARRDVERELGQAFEATDVYRRQDVEPSEEGIEVREGAEPLRDPTGEQAAPESYGARSMAARTAAELGVTLDDNALRLAARDIQADPQADPVAIVRSYATEERQQAFDRADIQRRRGEDYARDREGRIADFEAQPEQVQQRIRREYAARGIDPDQVANAFTRAARQGEMREVGDLREEQAAESRREFSRPAFESAERRRQRREEDLATGERVDHQASTYRTAEAPYERQARREVTLLGARRDRRGQLVGGEAVEVLARGQRQTPNGELQDMARIVRNGEDPVWVPADQLETVTTPENPRMFGEALGQTREPPRGVMRERGDGPEQNVREDTLGAQTQTPQPRRAVDRQSDPQGLRRGLFEEGGPEPGPRGPASQAEAETFDGTTGRPYREAETSEMTPQGEARTEFQGEGGEMPVTRTRRPVREARSYDVRMREPDPEGELNLDSARRMSDEEMDAMFEAGTAQPAARPEPEPAQPATPQAQGVNANAPERLADPEMAQALRDSKQDYGWAERGGNLLRDREGKPTGRTRWLPRNQELMDALKNKKVTEDGYKKLVDRALDPEAKPLTNRQRTILEEVLEAIDPRARERAEAEAEADMDAQFGRPDQEPGPQTAQPREEAAQGATPRPQDTLKALGVAAKRGGNPEQTLAQARQALDDLDALVRDGGKATGAKLREIAGALGQSKAGTVADIRERLEAWRKNTPDRYLEETARYSAAYREGALTARQAYEQGLIESHPKAFPPKVRALVRDTGKTGKPDWQKTVEEVVDERTPGYNPRREGDVAINQHLNAVGMPAPHRRAVNAALEAGLDVPPRVMDSYPERSPFDTDAEAQEPDADTRRRQRIQDRKDAAGWQLRMDIFDAKQDGRRPDTLQDALDTLEDPDLDRSWSTERRSAAMKMRGRYIAQAFDEAKAEAESLEWTGRSVESAPTEVVARRSQNPAQANKVVLDLLGNRSSTERRHHNDVMRKRLEQRGIEVEQQEPHGAVIDGDQLDDALEAVDLPVVGDAVGDMKPRDQMGEVVERGQLRDDYELDEETTRQMEEHEQRPARERAEQEARQKAEIDEGVDAFDLEAQTEETLREGADRTREAEDARRRQRLNEERRAQADKEADDFTLTGSDRPADEAAARGQMDLTDQPAQGGTDRPSGGTQLYSGIPLDRIAAAVKKVMGGEARSWREMTERVGMLLESSREAAGGASARNRATKRSPFTDLWRVTLASLDGDLRTLVGKFDSPTLKSLPDMFHATAGRGDGVGQTFDEAVQARNNPRLQEVDRIVSALRDAGLSKLDQQERVMRLVENPRAKRSGELGRIAGRIEAFLKEELDYLRKAGVEVGEVRDGYFPREADSGKAAADPDGFIRAATRAYKAMGARDADAKAQAEAYWESVVYGASGKPGAPRQGSQTPSFVQSRQFTKAAAEHLAAYRVKDIDAVLSQYVMRATRRGEIARRFGDNWKDWADIETRIKREDPDAGAILPLVRDRVALSAGVNLHGMGAAMQHSLSGLRTWTTLATLPKAAMSSVGELVIAPWRGTTGSLPGDLGASLMNLWAHLGNFTQTVTGMGRSEKLQAAFEMAEDIGIIAGTGHNSLMAARFAGGDPVGRVQSEVLASFFRRNLLEGLTNYTRVTSMRQGQVFLRRVAKQMERHPERSGYFLRELGVARGDEAAFAAYVRSLGDDLPSSAALSGRHAQAYRTALQRFTDQTVMRPSASTKPKYASHPLGAVIFQLQAFAYSFQKNVLNRQARLLASKDLSYADKLAFSAGALPAVALLVGVQGMMRDIRDALYDPDVRERKTPAAHLEGAVSQAGLFGIADPYLQSLTGIRYQRNPLASFMGPAASGLAESTMALSQGALNNSDNTNTGERNLAQATYDWLIEPAGQALLTAAPGGPVTGKLASAATIYGLPKGRDTFTDTLAGPRNSSRKKPPIQGTLEWLLGEDAGSSRGGRGGGRSGSRDAGRSGSR